MFTCASASLQVEHRAFLSALEKRTSIRDYVLAAAADAAADSDAALLRDVYNACLDAMAAFRSSHMRLVARYILQQVNRRSGSACPANADDGDGAAGGAACPAARAAHSEPRTGRAETGGATASGSVLQRAWQAATAFGARLGAVGGHDAGHGAGDLAAVSHGGSSSAAHAALTASGGTRLPTGPQQFLADAAVSARSQSAWAEARRVDAAGACHTPAPRTAPAGTPSRGAVVGGHVIERKAGGGATQALGTGGTSIVEFLKDTRASTLEARVDGRLGVLQRPLSAGLVHPFWHGGADCTQGSARIVDLVRV
jgi:hypothetical protein